MLKGSISTKKTKKPYIKGDQVFRNEMFPEAKVPTYPRGEGGGKEGWGHRRDLRGVHSSSREGLPTRSVTHCEPPSLNSLQTRCHPLLSGARQYACGLGTWVIERTGAREPVRCGWAENGAQALGGHQQDSLFCHSSWHESLFLAANSGFYIRLWIFKNNRQKSCFIYKGVQGKDGWMKAFVHDIIWNRRTRNCYIMGWGGERRRVRGWVG